MAVPSDERPGRETRGGTFSDRAAKRRSEPGLSRRLAHTIDGAATGAVLSAAGLHVLEKPIPTLMVMATTALGNVIVGEAHERYGHRQGHEAGLAEGRRQGREAAMREAGQRHGRSFVDRVRPGERRDRGGR